MTNQEQFTENTVTLSTKERKIPFVKSLRFRMPFTLVMLGIIPPVILGIGFASYRATKIIHQDAEKIIGLEAAKLENNISQWLKMNVAALKNISEQPDIISLKPEKQKPILENLLHHYENLYIAHTTDLAGTNIARSDDKPADKYPDRKWLHGAKAGNEITYQTLVGKTSKKPAVCMSTPILKQKIIKAVAITCSTVDAIAEQVRQIDLGKTGVAIVVDETGQVVAHTNPEYTSGDNLINLAQFPPVSNILAGNQGKFIFADEEGIEWISQSKSLKNGWKVMTLQQTREAFAGEREYQQVAVLLILVIILVTSTLTFIIASSGVKPIIELTDVSLNVADGNFDTRLEDNRQDEIGVLLNSFNQMAQKLQKSIADLENKAEEQILQKEKLELAIYNLLDEVSEATEGDLTVRANLDSMELSTVADLFNAIINNLEEIAIEAKKSSGQVGTSLKENEQAIRLLAEQAIAEAQATSNTLKSVAKMSQSIKAVAENASQVEKIADDTYHTVVDSTSNMNLTVDSILELRNTVNATANKMQLLGQSSQKISQAVTLIEEIALKINVLAVNARVEARRAGEYGQGFTIVAEQVGALAEQSVKATQEITNIVSAIQLETSEVSEAMKSGTVQAVKSSELVEATKQSLTLVLDKSQEINQLMSSISQATVSQADTSQDITVLMEKIAQLSAITSKSSSEVAKSIKATAQVAAKLESTVAQFKVAESM